LRPGQSHEKSGGQQGIHGHLGLSGARDEMAASAQAIIRGFAPYVFSAFAMAQPLKRFVFLATDGSLCVQGTQADAHGFSASICEICAICGQKKAKLTEGQRPKPYEFSGFTALNTYICP
jgi:hypothetical protein